jgi:hypothetical protein
VLCGVWTLWPRGHSFIEPDGLDNWANAAGQTSMDGAVIRQQTLVDLATQLTKLRRFSGHKVKRLRTTYVSYALALLVIAIDAGIFFVAAL